ncbi:MAG: GNAT family N-acetyltransferase [Coriobacteriia bacterium]|nr:GNAT family N-acetyltransferase [Coriobacteriia bacterium]
MTVKLKMAANSEIEMLIQARLDFFDDQGFDMDSESRTAIKGSLKSYFNQHLGDDFFAALIVDAGNIVSVAFLVVAEKPASPVFPTGKTGTILNVLTYPEHRRKGYALMTMGKLIEEAQQQDLSYLELRASELGKALYQKLGFEEIEPSRMSNMRLPLLK